MKWPATPGDLLALACIWLAGALMALAAVELIAATTPPVFPRSIQATPIEMPLPATPYPTPLYAAIPPKHRPLWMMEILMGPCRKHLPQPRCTPPPEPPEYMAR